MRTLKEIDAEVAEKAKARTEEIFPSVSTFMKPQEIMNMQCEAQFNDKYREMHALLVDVEKYLLRITHTYPRTHANLLKRLCEI